MASRSDTTLLSCCLWSVESVLALALPLPSLTRALGRWQAFAALGAKMEDHVEVKRVEPACYRAHFGGAFFCSASTPLPRG
jgi:hypothetical protein